MKSLRLSLIGSILALLVPVLLLGSRTHAAPIADGEFAAHWQRPMSEALAYLFAKANERVVESKSSTALYEVAYGDVVEGFRFAPKFENSGRLVMRLEIDKRLKDNPVIALQALTLISGFSTFDGFRLTTGPKGESAFTYLKIPKDRFKMVVHPLEWAELLVNASAGQQLARRELADLTLKSFAVLRPETATEFFAMSVARGEGEQIAEVKAAAQFYGLEITNASNLRESLGQYLAGRSGQLRAQLEAKTRAAQKEFRETQKLTAQQDMQKKIAESATEKLNDLILKNDREGVAKLIEEFLPWSEMGAIEKGMWINWVEAIRRPQEVKAVLAFRGIESDEPVLRRPRSETIAFVSTVLSKNQGNYTRRLRSLKMMRLRLGTVNSYGDRTLVSPLKGTPKLSSMLANHSSVPAGSPFLSFTRKLDVAANFATGGGIVVAKVDSRRLLHNLPSRVKAEGELLLPLILFPDEILHVQPIDSYRREALEAVNKFVAEYQTRHATPFAAEIEDGYRQFARAIVTAQRDGRIPLCKAAFLE